MKTNVRDMAKYLNVSEKTIYRWIKEKGLPAHRLNNQFRFNRAEVLEWAISESINVSSGLLSEEEEVAIPTLYDAILSGGVFYRVGGNNVETVLNNVVSMLPLPNEVNRDFLYQVLLTRESMGSTGIGDGIAIPHARNPIVQHIPQPMISLCFLEEPIDFKAIDGKPVHTLFMIVSPSSKAHLQLLSRLSFCLRKAELMKLIKEQGRREDIFACIKKIEETFA